MHWYTTPANLACRVAHTGLADGADAFRPSAVTAARVAAGSKCNGGNRSKCGDSSTL